MAIGTKGTLFDPVLVADLATKVKGHSSLAMLSGQTPVPSTETKNSPSLWMRTWISWQRTQRSPTVD